MSQGAWVVERTCPHCGGQNLYWMLSIDVRDGKDDTLIPVLLLRCEPCAETLSRVTDAGQVVIYQRKQKA